MQTHRNQMIVHRTVCVVHSLTEKNTFDCKFEIWTSCAWFKYTLQSDMLQTNSLNLGQEQTQNQCSHHSSDGYVFFVINYFLFENTWCVHMYFSLYLDGRGPKISNCDRGNEVVERKLLWERRMLSEDVDDSAATTDYDLLIRKCIIFCAFCMWYCKINVFFFHFTSRMNYMKIAVKIFATFERLLDWE